jgi:hypothetical protein
MTRICLLVNQYSYRHARVQRFAEALADAGAIVDMLCLRERNRTAIGEPRGVRVITIPVSRQIRDNKGLLFEYLAAFVLFSVRLLILHAKNRYHVIQVHNMPDFLVFAAFIPRLLGAKLILDICDPMPEIYLSKTAGRGNGNLALRLQQDHCRQLCSGSWAVRSRSLLRRATPSFRPGGQPSLYLGVPRHPRTPLWPRLAHPSLTGADTGHSWTSTGDHGPVPRACR